MMDREMIPEGCIIAEGPAGLASVLDEMLTKTKADTGFAREEHYILYRLGDQKSLIKVDTNQLPFIFYYSDMLGRPATKAVKDTIARFLWEKCGEKEKYTQDTGREDV